MRRNPGEERRPRPGAVLSSRVPFTRSTRSRMLSRPRLRPSFGCAGSKPDTVVADDKEQAAVRPSQRDARGVRAAWRATLFSASCATRNRHSSASFRPLETRIEVHRHRQPTLATPPLASARSASTRPSSSRTDGGSWSARGGCPRSGARARRIEPSAPSACAPSGAASSAPPMSTGEHAGQSRRHVVVHARASRSALVLVAWTRRRSSVYVLPCLLGFW